MDIAIATLTLANSVVLILVLRHLALSTPAAARAGPRVGSVLSPWSLQTIDGRNFQSMMLPASYVLVVVSTSCLACRDLFRDLSMEDLPEHTLSPMYLMSMGEAVAVREAMGKVPDGYFAEVLVGAEFELLTALKVPSTPHAIAVRDGHVAAAKTANRGWVLRNLAAIAGQTGEEAGRGLSEGAAV